MLHGLLEKSYITGLKLDPSFNETSFATEYLSLWQGASQESWFNFDKLMKYRKIKNPENHAKNITSSSCFYLISVDVGRINDQTIACIFRVNVDGQGRHWATLVNLKVLARSAETKTFSQ
jgi:phage terminase large subunit-like protein